MRVVSNVTLAEAFKARALAGESVLIVPLGSSTEQFVAPMKAFGKNHYFQFSDGTSEFLVVSRDPRELYKPLLNLEIGDVRIERDQIVVDVTHDEGPVVQMAELRYGRPYVAIVGTPGDRHLSFPIADFSAEIHVGTVVSLDVTFEVEDAGTFRVSHLVPFIEVDALLRRPARALRSAQGYLRVYHEGLDDHRLELLASLIADGELPARLIEPFGDATGAPMETRTVSGVPFATVDARGHRFLLTHPKAGLIDSLPPQRALEIAETSSWRAPEARLAKLRKRAKREVALTAFGVLGYERYSRTKFRMRGITRRPTPYRRYVNALGSRQVRPATMLLEGFNGNEFAGSLLALARAMTRAHPEVELYVAARDVPAVDAKLARAGVKASVVPYGLEQYHDRLLDCAYLVTDTTFPRYVLKQPGQVMINVWHGTPLKAMGRQIRTNPLALANSQRNFLMCDAVLLSNEHTIETMGRDYMVPPGILRPFPAARNEWFFDQEHRGGVRAELGVGPDETLVLWMPTWRGTGNTMDDVAANVALFERMARVRQRLGSGVRFFAKPHQLVSASVDVAELGFEELDPAMDTYEVAAAADALLTDYSSIMFDFGLSGRPIVLDLFDREEYAAQRGFCLDPGELPVLTARDEEELVAVLQDLPDSADHGQLNSRFNPHDCADAGLRLAEEILGMLPSTGSSRPFSPDERPSVLLYPGTMLTNGITASFLNLLSNLDHSRFHFVALLPAALIRGAGIENLGKVLDAGIDYIASPAGTIITNDEAEVWDRFLMRLPLDAEQDAALTALMIREARRFFHDYRFDHVVHFTGYDALIARLFVVMDATRHTWVHNNMREELLLRNNFNERAVLDLYDASATIAVVSEGVRDKLVAEYFTPEVLPRVTVVHNTVDSGSVIERSAATEDYLTPELEDLLSDPNRIRFVNIARFSPEKGQVRLLEAFEAICERNPDRQFELFVIGGHGNARSALDDLRALSPRHDRIHFFENINPMPILARSDLFVLSSYYEGLPMVFFEALALDVPILSTRIPGPEAFLESGYGHVVDNSTEGLIEGMQRFVDGRLSPPTGSLEEFNRQAVAEFMAILG